MGNIIFDGYNFEDYGVVVSGSGTWNMPERLTEKENVYGRHGALITDAGMPAVSDPGDVQRTPRACFPL